MKNCFEHRAADIAALAREATALLHTDDPERRAAFMEAKAEMVAACTVEAAS